MAGNLWKLAWERFPIQISVLLFFIVFNFMQACDSIGNQLSCKRRSNSATLTTVYEKIAIPEIVSKTT